MAATDIHLIIWEEPAHRPIDILGFAAPLDFLTNNFRLRAIVRNKIEAAMQGVFEGRMSVSIERKEPHESRSYSQNAGN